tara:strand:- start:1354 stop:1512 length:159 start_codon:yes stop_codon:yes gene_type:complete
MRKEAAWRIVAFPDAVVFCAHAKLMLVCNMLDDVVTNPLKVTKFSPEGICSE